MKEKEMEDKKCCIICRPFQMIIKNLYSLVKVILSDLLSDEKHNKLPPNNVKM